MTDHKIGQTDEWDISFDYDTAGYEAAAVLLFACDNDPEKAIKIAKQMQQEAREGKRPTIDVERFREAFYGGVFNGIDAIRDRETTD